MQTLSAIEYHSAAAVFAGAKAARARLMNARAWERPKPVVRMLPPPEPVFEPTICKPIDAFEAYQNATQEPTVPEGEVAYERGKIYVYDVLRVTAAYFGLGVSDLRTRTRVRHICSARQIAMYVARAITGFSLPEIGRRMGGFDHSTIHHSVSKIEARRITHADVNQAIEEITARLKRVE
jgi:hypothetical protein